ncbi:PREDICTED: sperm acrosome membrane-associated protein 4-like [Elephantulus edwardii]|uniref:sperm acrosome membrane-associated protein 4-like n=1 Tax=Elephantulus edwardii TaxID=28737 RepID=UPI0003F0F029|nr:PREDICTED: sperm acrosome membrane-associated protein 4-like [Elephantulus edwardii]
MGTSSIFLCLLYLCGALGLNTSPAPRRLRCYLCNFAKPCYPVPTECQDDEVCSISTGTSEQGETIERRGCILKSQCPLQGQATYWSRSYTLLHRCCHQDLCNSAMARQRLPSPLLLTTPLLLAAGFTWGGHLFH